MSRAGTLVQAEGPEWRNLEHRPDNVGPYCSFAPRVVDTRWREPYHRRMGPTSETYRYIVRSAGVRSGNPIVEGTRIAVHDVIGLLQNGETVETLKANCFPQLTRSQVYECLAYYEDHRGEIDLLVASQMALPSE